MSRPGTTRVRVGSCACEGDERKEKTDTHRRADALGSQLLDSVAIAVQWCNGKAPRASVELKMVTSAGSGGGVSGVDGVTPVLMWRECSVLFECSVCCLLALIIRALLYSHSRLVASIDYKSQR